MKQLGLVGVVEASVPQALQQSIGSTGEDGVTAAAGDVAEGVGEEGLADADRADDRHVGGLLEERIRILAPGSTVVDLAPAGCAGPAGPCGLRRADLGGSGSPPLLDPGGRRQSSAIAVVEWIQ